MGGALDRGEMGGALDGGSGEMGGALVRVIWGEL